MSADVVLLERVWPPAIPDPGHVSQIGGWPNLPAEMDWPEIVLADGGRVALDFLAQIDLAELPNVTQRALLPAAGTLYFFALSQSHVPLEEFGPGAARVLYSPVSARGVQPRRPPPNAGWNQDELNHGRTVAAEYRDTDAPRGELHPRCPVVARGAQIGSDGIADAAIDRIETSFDFYRASLPRRVEDATLYINFARNHWRENIIPFDGMRDHFTRQAREYVNFEGKPLPGGWVPPQQPRPIYVDNCLSEAFWATFRTDYSHWRDEAVSLKAQLLALGRDTLLLDDQREAVHGVVEAGDRLARQVSRYGLYLDSRGPMASRMALATLLLQHPEIARKHGDEVAAAHPGQQRRRAISHRMLGPPYDVQGDTMSGEEPILLLQLDSDEWGPRLSWWDGGNLTFWISAPDAAAGRFDRARAEIEGH
ncbi:DUF1963 domain-containing protein [Bradyrhizobium xenonodulans]|uniref:DUF1963 domain-containing protein n=1 Tax=Bradyrhizobium xenonodulans TaxID=2736875 RepID=A0ABY7MJ78_9BRAD|nr:DUF1963 domain-containing protein [Bradyrhizobium xenonodulans]WBL78456.1 DUF1963 domain-containing protein [Bradyrhizobium xenonodulans]